MLACEGLGGLVLQVRARERTGDLNFVTCMRQGVREHYGENPVGLGGVFLLAKGRAKLHVMVSVRPHT